ncbi:MAG: hypothetical protein [Bacteriophage sp.]|nr:MAG: hypothetical protein [Bacteriophage sp.]
MTVKELIEILKTCDETAYPIDEVIDYSNNFNEVVISIE